MKYISALLAMLLLASCSTNEQNEVVENTETNETPIVEGTENPVIEENQASAIETELVETSMTERKEKPKEEWSADTNTSAS